MPAGAGRNHRTFDFPIRQALSPSGAHAPALLVARQGPGGNATGFTTFEYGMSGKWLELLKQIAPSITRAAVLRDPAIASGIGQFGAVRLALLRHRRGPDLLRA
jgi:hypothetical protein